MPHHDSSICAGNVIGQIEMVGYCAKSELLLLSASVLYDYFGYLRKSFKRHESLKSH